MEDLLDVLLNNKFFSIFHLNMVFTQSFKETFYIRIISNLKLFIFQFIFCFDISDDFFFFKTLLFLPIKGHRPISSCFEQCFPDLSICHRAFSHFYPVVHLFIYFIFYNQYIDTTFLRFSKFLLFIVISDLLPSQNQNVNQSHHRISEKVSSNRINSEFIQKEREKQNIVFAFTLEYLSYTVTYYKLNPILTNRNQYVFTVQYKLNYIIREK